MGKIESELMNLINLGRIKEDTTLQVSAEEALASLYADDGTPGLGSFLWKEYVIPNLHIARSRAHYHMQTNRVINFAYFMTIRRKCKVLYCRKKERIPKTCH